MTVEGKPAVWCAGLDMGMGGSDQGRLTHGNAVANLHKVLALDGRVDDGQIQPGRLGVPRGVAVRLEAVVVNDQLAAPYLDPDKRQLRRPRLEDDSATMVGAGAGLGRSLLCDIVTLGERC